MAAPSLSFRPSTMIDWTHPHILQGSVMHHRHRPSRNVFRYGHWTLAFDIKTMPALNIPYLFAVNSPCPLSLHTKDYADGQPCASWHAWLHHMATQHHIPIKDKHIVLITMPRVLGYLFNPVSFWLFIDQHTKRLCAVIAEVNNTFGERHHYICHPLPKKQGIDEGDVLRAQKCFYVSPFLKIEGHYDFRFSLKEDAINIFITYYDGNSRLTLSTSLTGTLTAYRRAALLTALRRHPHITWRTIMLIHWQALKLFLKRIPVISKDA
ncbi:MAG: DUF1365 domain-containing protein [Alphaproteobacteria bacterium GM7ARS4]|nr:DUF1365 domain-containing protein [Alphaproteobacteria bacterium GM7ARS4]